MKKIVYNQTSKTLFWNLQQMNEMRRHFCWHQNFVPWGLSAPAPGLYTCIKSWKKLYKIRLQRHCFETCNKWMKWQDISVDIKTLSPGGCLPLPRGYIHVLNHEKNCIKSDFKDIVLKLATNEWNEKTFLLTSKLCSLGAVCLYKYLIMKKLYKIRLQRDFFETCNKWVKW